MNSDAIAYYALSSGRKPRTAGDLKNAPGIRLANGASQFFAASKGLSILLTYPDHCTSPRANFFHRNSFLEAIEHAEREQCALIVFDYFGLLARLKDKEDLLTHARIIKSGIVVYDSKLSINVSDMNGETLGVLLLSARKTKSMRSWAIKTGLENKKHKGGHPNKGSLARAQRRGSLFLKTGADRFAKRMQPTIDGIDTELKATGKSTFSAIAGKLNARGYTTRRGKQWRAQSVKRVRERSVEFSPKVDPRLK